MAKIWIGTSNGCWINVWDRVNYQGNRVRLHGPADLRQLRFGEAQWSANVMSCVVGPWAFVECYDEKDITANSFWLFPDQNVSDVSKLEGGDELDPLRLFDRPPFGSERGYDAYVVQVATGLKPQKYNLNIPENDGHRRTSQVNPFYHSPRRATTPGEVIW